MRTFTALGLLVIGTFFQYGCEKNNGLCHQAPVTNGQCLKGVLVKKGICGQRVIQITSQDKTGVAFAVQWKDESSGKTYENVFTVDNSCSFPAAVNEGDELGFKLTADKTNNCAQCQAFTPVPAEKNSIVVDSACYIQKK